MGKKLVNKLLVIGWDSADWKVINPLIQQGKMPALKKLIDGGISGRIKTLDPPLSPMLWTSIATGFRADKHGIGGFIEPTPNGQGLRPVTSTSRKVKAIWNILNQKGYKSNVVAWWPSNPAEPINGVMVSNLYQGGNTPYGQEWKMPKGTIHPPEMEDVLKGLRVHREEITGAMLYPFIPNIKDDKELRKEKRAGGVVKVISDAASVHAASTYLLRETEWDFMAIYHDALDHFSHLAMKYHPPRRDFIPEKDYENYKGVVEAGYRFHDMMLERTLDLIDDDTTVILVSDHGFHCDHLRPKMIPKEPAGPAVEHNPYGVVIMSGPGIKKGQSFSGAKVIDIAPTILSLFGLPIGQDMEGKPLVQCFDEPTEVEYIESWEKVPGNDGMHSKYDQEDPWAAQEAMQQLVELGYIEAMDGDKLEEVEKAKRESKYYVARNLIDGQKLDEGIKMLEEIFTESNIIRYGQRLAYAYLRKGRFKECEELIGRLKIAEKEQFDTLKKEKLEKDPNDPFGNSEMEDPLYLEFVEGLLYLSQNKTKKALPLLEKVQAKTPANFSVALNIANIYLKRKKYVSAEEQYIRALSIDELNPAAHHGLGVSFLRRGMLEQAIEELFIAVELNFNFVNAHYHLGEALARSGRYEEAVQAFEVAVRLSPGMSKAHKWLSEIYSNNLKQPEKAKEHEAFIRDNIKGEIVVVSGLPRSGTSMMMQMLKAGGMEILSDGEREADNNNPKGYLEFEKVKSLHKNQDWIGDAEGKCVKIIAQLLNYLPEEYNYKIIMMERDMTEVIASQQKMLGKKVTPDTLPLGLFNTFRSQLDKIDAWIDSQPRVNILRVNYKDVIEHPETQAERVAGFVTNPIDVKKMAEAVDTKLYRNKI